MLHLVDVAEARWWPDDEIERHLEAEADAAPDAADASPLWAAFEAWLLDQDARADED